MPDLPLEKPKIDEAKPFTEFDKFWQSDPSFLDFFNRLRSEQTTPNNYRDMAKLITDFSKIKKDYIKVCSDKKAEWRKFLDAEFKTWKGPMMADAYKQVAPLETGFLNYSFWSEEIKGVSVQALAASGQVNTNFSRALEFAYMHPDQLDTNLRERLIVLADRLEKDMREFQEIKDQLKGKF